MKEIKNPEDRLLTRAEVAEIFQVSPSTITRWAEAGKLPSVKTLGGHHRYQAKVVMALAQHFIKQETNMEKTFISVPAMYGDHHVLEVRRILLALRGVEEVNASSSLHAVEVSYDAAEMSANDIKARLDEACYLGELSVPSETGVAVTQEAKRDKGIFFRHATAYEQTKKTVAFAQTVQYSGRPLWACPGMGVIRSADMQKELEEAADG